MSQLVTLCDTVSALLDKCMAPEDDTRTIRLLTSAVQQTMRDLPKKHKWKQYKQHLRFRASAAIAPTVTYVESTRTLTITDNTSVWPSDVVYGEIMFGNTPYAVEQRVSNTVIVLSSASTPGENYEGEVRWQRDRYTFTRIYTKIDYLINLDTRLPLMFLDVATFYERQRLIRFTGIPTLFTIRGSTTPGYTDIVLSPPSINTYLFEALVTVQPDVPKIYKLSGSDGAITSNTKTFNSSGASFTSDCVGAVLRLYENPGDIPFGLPTFETVITSRDSATQLTLQDACPTTVSNGIYVVSSLLDIDPTLMQTCVENLSYANYCQNHDHKGLGQATVIAKQTLMEAIALDSKLNQSTSRDFGWQLAWARPHEYAQVITG